MASTQRTGWQKVARRIRVPLGFVTAIVFLAFARSTWILLAASLPMVLAGLWLRAYAAGYVKKNMELTRTGPYAHTRNPLYLGSMLIAFGFALAAGRWSLGVLLLGLFLLIYIPTILSEETFLRSTFPEFDAYAKAVPRLLPRPTPARFGAAGNVRAAGLPSFSRERYLHHREYNAAMGSGAIYLLLLARMLLARGHV